MTRPHPPVVAWFPPRRRSPLAFVALALAALTLLAGLTRALTGA